MKRIGNISKKKAKFESQVNELKMTKKQQIQSAGRITRRKEEIPYAIEGLNGAFFELVQRERDREKHLKQMNDELLQLVEDYKHADNQGEVQRLERQCQKLQQDMQATHKEKSNMETR